MLEDRRLLAATQLHSLSATLVSNQAPALTAPPDQSIPITQDTFDVTLVATDPDNDPLTYSAVPLPGEYYLDQTLSFSFAGDVYLNTSGTLNEKWVQASDQTWYLITPNGGFWQWTGEGTAAQIPDNRVYVATLSTDVYDDPSLLYDAQPDEYYLDQTLGLNFTGEFYFNVSGTLHEKWLQANDSTWFFLTPEGRLWRWTGNGSAAEIPVNRALVAKLSSTTYANPADLYDAVPTTSTVTVSGSTVTIDPNSEFSGIFGVEASVSDGSLSDSNMFSVSVLPCSAADGFGYRACVASPTFENIRTSGTGVLLNSDDGVVELTDEALGDFQFDFYGSAYSSLFVNSNGLITFGSGNAEWRNADLTASPSQPAIAPLWDDLVSTGTADGVYWEVRGSDDTQTLIVQWNDVDYIGSHGKITFQAVLSEADKSIQFNYLDLSGNDAEQDEAASATVGIKDVGIQGANRLLSVFGNHPNAFARTGTSTRIVRRPTVTLTVDDATIPENGAVATLTATLSVASILPVSVDLGFSGTATENDDYTRSNSRLVFPPGDTTRTFTVTTLPDNLVENDETVVVEIRGVTNAVELGTQQASVTISDNQAPSLSSPGSQTLAPTADSLNLALIATDPDNDPLTFTAAAHTHEYFLDQTRGLNFTGNFYFNVSGTLNEKWLRGNDLTWYFLTPDGYLWQWTGSGSAAQIPANRLLVATLSPAVYDTPALLYAAQPGAAPATATVSGSTLKIDPNPGFVGSFSVAATVSDGRLSDASLILVTVSSCTPPDGSGYRACVATPSFEDIRSTGTRVLPSSDDAAVELTDTLLGDFQFKLYEITYASLFVSTNGLITFTSSNTEWRNTDLTSSPSQAVIAPLWDDLVTSGSADAVYWELRGSGSAERLIVQWTDVDYIGATGKITFQAIMSEADRSIQFNYFDLAGSDAQQDEAASATVGIKDSGVQGTNRLLLSFDNAPSAFVGTGRSTRIVRTGALTSSSKTKADTLTPTHDSFAQVTTWLPETRLQIGVSPPKSLASRPCPLAGFRQETRPAPSASAPSARDRQTQFDGRSRSSRADLVDLVIAELSDTDVFPTPFD